MWRIRFQPYFSSSSHYTHSVVILDILFFSPIVNVNGIEVPPLAVDSSLAQELGQKEDDFNATNDGKPGEESHCASDETQLSLHLDLLVSLNVVKGCRVKVDPEKSEVWFNWYLNS